MNDRRPSKVSFARIPQQALQKLVESAPALVTKPVSALQKLVESAPALVTKPASALTKSLKSLAGSAPTLVTKPASALTRSLKSLAAVNDIEKLAQKSGTNSEDERFLVRPDYGYPKGTKLNREELRAECNQISSYFHDLQSQSQSQSHSRELIGTLSVEVLQCFGIPKEKKLTESSAFCVLVLGSHAFKTDVMPQVANPMWLKRMRRACVFPIYEAYARLMVGVFSKSSSPNTKDGFAGRIVVDIARLRSASTYDVTLPLRQSTHIYSKEQRGAIRIRFHLDLRNEQKALLSYLPKAKWKIQPNEDTTIACCDLKSFQNTARVVHGHDMPGKFSMRRVKAMVREVNFTRIHILRYIRKREFRDTMQWKYPFLSGFVFMAWMHCVWDGNVRYVPGHTITFLLLHLWRNYARYAIDVRATKGFLAPTWEELLWALLRGKLNRPCIEPITLERKDSSTVKTAMSHFGSTSEIHEEQSLHTVAQAFREGVQTNKHRFFFKSYSNSFVGSEAVDFLLEQKFATTRHEAVDLGRRLQKELSLFEHVTRRHDFLDAHLYYVFLDYDYSEYVCKTHKPWGQALFRFIGFSNPPSMMEAEVQLEFPYATGIDHPRFTVKESLVIRSKESQKMLLSMQAAQEELEDVDELGANDILLSQLLESGNGAASDNISTSRGISNSSAHSSPGMPSTPFNLSSRSISSIGYLDDDSAFGDDDIDPSAPTFETKILSKPPIQDILFTKKGDQGDQKITDILTEARHTFHGVLGHVFNDRVYKMEAPTAAPTSTIIKPTKESKLGLVKKNRLAAVARRVKATSTPQTESQEESTTPPQIRRMRSDASDNVTSRRAVPKQASAMTPRSFRPTKKNPELENLVALQARQQDYNKALNIGKYSHPNPLVAKLAVIVQPIVEIAIGWLCLFRAAFNAFTWRDPILSFWISVLGPLLVLALHLFPWRLAAFVVGIVLVGPQNWLLRLIRESKDGYEEPNIDMVVKKKKLNKEQVDEKVHYFSSYAPDNQPIDEDELDKSDLRLIVNPHSQLMYGRFYDWPPEPDYASVYASGPPQSVPEAASLLQSQQFETKLDDSGHLRKRWRPKLPKVLRRKTNDSGKKSSCKDDSKSV
jgi:hypothetical protein